MSMDSEERIKELEERVEALTRFVGIIACQVADSPLASWPANDGRTQVRLVRKATKQEIHNNIVNIAQRAGLEGLEIKVM